MRIIKSYTLIILMGIAAVGLTITSARAGVEPSPFVDWGDAFALQTSGAITNPLVLVGFNPQPEPPGTTLNFSNPLSPTFNVAGVSQTAEAPLTFQILFAMITPLSITFGDPTALGEPGTRGDVSSFNFQARDVGDEVLFDINFNLTTSSGGTVVPGEWVGFNPQPEPPGFPAGSGPLFAFNFFFSSLSTATLSLNIQDGDGQALSFAPAVIPLPAALPLFLTGLAGLALIKRRRRQA